MSFQPSSVHNIKNLLDKTRGNHVDIPMPGKSLKQSSASSATSSSSQNNATKNKASISAKPKVFRAL